jgi:hypothetical protein
VPDWLAPHVDALGAGSGGGASLEAGVVEEEGVEEKRLTASIVAADGDKAIIGLVVPDVCKRLLIDHELCLYNILLSSSRGCCCMKARTCPELLSSI